MYGAIVVRDGVTDAWRARRIGSAVPTLLSDYRPKAVDSTPRLKIAPRRLRAVVVRVRDLRARARIRYTLWPPMHPAGLRCSSLAYTRYARSSRLAGRAPRRPQCTPYSCAGPWGPAMRRSERHQIRHLRDQRAIECLAAARIAAIVVHEEEIAQRPVDEVEAGRSSSTRGRRCCPEAAR